MRFEPTGATPRMLVPVMTIASVGALVCAAAAGAAGSAAVIGLVVCSGALSAAVAGRFSLALGVPAAGGVVCANAGVASTSASDNAEPPHFRAWVNFVTVSLL